ncbi:branched-chain amino acid ABC transporter permease [Isoptericola dokdonensis]|jgi:neutral amino acid transport system permease protein|uniref:Leucine/isoleucine/valine transporter permease subunit n=1 Tax=Isoptericola dokdonensis DS-3 TaxID=1300344 RepID=A0A168FME1_9MICO|nr:branched-chain amino acid ABC transporter permease [Isoptericola dokdonensis]ANC32129.1 leucine/isoleucine/valine transporter permease subunit [Isoptericola dokdonensis DS-3]
MEEFLRILTQSVGELLAPATAAYALAAIGLNLHFGYTGLLNMGQAGFMLLGAYGFGITIIAGGSFWLALLVAVLAGVLFALLLGLPTLQLRGDYLAIVTISAAEIIRWLGRSTVWQEWTGGASGLQGRDYKDAFQDLSPLPDGRFALGPFEYINTGSDSWWTRIFAWGLVALVLLFVWLIARSPWGRVLKGIREDEDAVRALGKNVFSYKLQALVIGGAIGALGGVVFALPSAIAPDSMGRTMTFFVWTILLLGGAATVFGPVLGSMIFFAAYMFMRTGMRALAENTPVGEVISTTNVEQIGGMLVGVTLMLLVIFRPQGILGNKKELAFNVR